MNEGYHGLGDSIKNLDGVNINQNVSNENVDKV